MFPFDIDLKPYNEIESFICGICGLQQQRTKQVVISRTVQTRFSFLPPNLVDRSFLFNLFKLKKKNTVYPFLSPTQILFVSQAVSSSLLPTEQKEDLTKPSAITSFRVIFDDLGNIILQYFKQLSKNVMTKSHLLPSTYFCAQSFQVYVYKRIQNKTDAKFCLILELNIIHPQIH